MFGFELAKSRGVFVTGTDTGVGKTLVSAAIAKYLNIRGVVTGVFKPIASGSVDLGGGELVSGDAEFLAAHSGSGMSVGEICPVNFLTPAAPVVCEEVEGREVDFDLIGRCYNNICSDKDAVVVEGIGGFLVPLSSNFTVADMAAEMGLSVVIVSRPDLGTLNHTLMSIACVRAKGLKVAGVVISGYKEDTASAAERTAGEVISGFGRTNILTVVDRDDWSSVEEGMLGEKFFSQVSGFDWREVI
jgi:dethiobiotin synthetase